MNNSWNWLGLLVWVLIIAWLVFIVMNIRKRHLEMIVIDNKHHSVKNTVIDILEILIFAVAFLSMFYLALLNKVDFSSNKDVSLSYSVKPLVIQTENAQGYYVEAKQSDKKHIVQYYTYWTNGNKYNVPGNNATISYGKEPVSLRAKYYSWPDAKKYDQEYQSAYVMTMNAKYKNNVINGLGLRAGRHATDYSIIRVPAGTFVKMEK